MPDPGDFLQCKNCHGPLKPGLDRCEYCGVYLVVPASRPWERVTKSRSARKGLIYPALILAGVAAVLYIYGYAFDDFSETELVRITPLWFFAITFGTYGYVAEKMLDRVAAGREPNIAAAYVNWRAENFKAHPMTAMLLSLLLITFTYVKTTSSLLTAFLGSAAWGVLLWIFFTGIFPAR